MMPPDIEFSDKVKDILAVTSEYSQPEPSPICNASSSDFNHNSTPTGPSPIQIIFTISDHDIRSSFYSAKSNINKP